MRKQAIYSKRLGVELERKYEESERLGNLISGFRDVSSERLYRIEREYPSVLVHGDDERNELSMYTSAEITGGSWSYPYCMEVSVDVVVSDEGFELHRETVIDKNIRNQPQYNCLLMNIRKYEEEYVEARKRAKDVLEAEVEYRKQAEEYTDYTQDETTEVLTA